jgi:hypothetical protein
MLRATAGQRDGQSRDATGAMDRIEAARREAEAQREKVPRRAPALQEDPTARRIFYGTPSASLGQSASVQAGPVDTTHPASRRSEGDGGTSTDNERSADSAATSSGQHKPRDKRIPTQTPATLWNEGMNQPLNCTVRDKSSSGAKVEFDTASGVDDVAEVVVGDQLTLTFNYPRERTTVACKVVWIAGLRCGLRFCGQFHTQTVGSRKSASGRANADKAAGAKAGVGKTGVGKAGRSVKKGKTGKTGLAHVVKLSLGNR